MFMQKNNLQNQLKTWVNNEMAKKLDEHGFGALPIKLRLGIFILTLSFVIFYVGVALVFVYVKYNGELADGILQGTALYIFSWLTTALGLALAGKDSIKYPIYFSAKLLRNLFPRYFPVSEQANIPEVSFFNCLNAWLVVAGLLIFLILKCFRQSAFFWIFVIAAFLINQTVYVYGMFASGSDIFFKSLRGRDLITSAEMPQVLFRFDDGPDVQYTLRILDILKEHHLKAIFAVVGSKVELYPEILQRIQAEGHIIANHTFSHSAGVLFMSRRRLKEEIQRTNELIAAAIGEPPRYFASPMGFRNPTIGKVIRELNLISLMWDVKTCDSQLPLARIMQRIKRLTKPKNIILLHDSQAICGKDSREDTVGALRESIEYFTDKGLL